MRWEGRVLYVHLLSAKNESLLDWWDTLFFLDTLLYAGDLCVSISSAVLCLILLSGALVVGGDMGWVVAMCGELAS